MTMDDIVQGAGLRAEEAAQGESDMAPIRKIGIIGAGQMGGGIAHVVALHGYDVALHDIAKERVDRRSGLSTGTSPARSPPARSARMSGRRRSPASPMPRRWPASAPPTS